MIKIEILDENFKKLILFFFQCENLFLQGQIDYSDQKS